MRLSTRQEERKKESFEPAGTERKRADYADGDSCAGGGSGNINTASIPRIRRSIARLHSYNYSNFTSIQTLFHLPTNKHTTNIMSPRLNAVSEGEQPVNEAVGYHCILQAALDVEQPVNEAVGYHCIIQAVSEDEQPVNEAVGYHCIIM